MAAPYTSVQAWSDPAEHACSVTPSDDTDLASAARALYVGTGGDVKLSTIHGEAVTFANVPVGVLPVRVARVYATGTTASDIVALW